MYELATSFAVLTTGFADDIEEGTLDLTTVLVVVTTTGACTITSSRLYFTAPFDDEDDPLSVEENPKF